MYMYICGCLGDCLYFVSYCYYRFHYVYVACERKERHSEREREVETKIETETAINTFMRMCAVDVTLEHRPKHEFGFDISNP